MNATELAILADGGWVPVVFFFFFVVIWIMGAIGSAVKKQKEQDERKRVRDSLGSPDWSDPSSVPPGTTRTTLPRGAQNRSGQNPQRSPMPAQRKPAKQTASNMPVGPSGSSRPAPSNRMQVPPLPPIPDSGGDARGAVRPPVGARATQASVGSTQSSRAADTGARATQSVGPEVARSNASQRNEELVQNVRLMLKNHHAKEAFVLAEILGKPAAER
jgi:hypothetical protein